MTSTIERFVQLPPAAKGALVIASGGTVLAAAALMLSPTAMYVVALGMALVALLLVGYRLLLKWWAKRRAAPMAQALSGNAGAAPQGISDPARRANLDSLRKSFENGVEKFKAAGKNLYALPWYALVGESGSGKTEAIRHCNVGFPPGLQDQLQGVGGTINMNWWFTNHAVILDTAGRMMFEEVEPGTTNEWQEFLRLLKRHRPNCPINGMLLVIPAESLIRDTADALEKKGGKIAQQLDNIQRVLGVRFPVFVVITKCDLINGFREFFDTIKDPQLQHQMVGWSNPADLDEPFNPDLVEQHLKTVQQRLQRRRLGLLIDPVHTEDSAARRADQVDALYAFPESLVKIAPRLRRYLEMIFVAGEWSAKPLFLRGIYLTSSMREGSALDADLAEALGRPVEALPEGRIWERDRAYFLRELFMQKVFKEKGLVTRAGNTRQQQRQRRALVVGTGALGLAIVGVFTWFGWRGLERSVVAPKEFWAQTSKVYTETPTEAYRTGAPPYLYPILYDDPEVPDRIRYRDPGDEKLRSITSAPAERRTAGQFPSVLADEAEKQIAVPWVFLPVAAVTGDRSGNLRAGERRDAARAVFESSVLRPVLDVARRRMAADLAANRWPPESDAAFEQLVRVEVAALERNSTPRAIDLAPLLKYSLGADTAVNDFDQFATADLPSLQQTIDRLYAPGSADQGWGARLASGDTDLLRRGAQAFAASWSGGAGNELGSISALITTLGAFADAETRLHALDNDPGNDAGAKIAAWTETLKVLRQKAADAEPGLAATGKRTLPTAYAEALEKRREALRKGLLGDLSPLAPRESGTPEVVAGSSETDKARYGALHEVRVALAKLLDDTTDVKALKDRLPAFEALHLSGGGLRRPLFQSRLAMYEVADTRLNPSASAGDVPIGGVRPAMLALNKSVSDGREEVPRLLEPVPETAPQAAQANALRNEAIGVSRFALQLAGVNGRARLITGFLKVVGQSDLGAAAEQFARDKGLVLAYGAVPLTMTAGQSAFEARYHPEAAEAVLGDASVIAQALSSEGNEDGVLGAATIKPQFEPARQSAARYAEEYLRYWSEGRNKDLAIAPMEWPQFHKALNPHNQTTLFVSGLERQINATEEAVKRVAPYIPKGFRIDPMQILEDAAQSRATLASRADGEVHAKVLGSWRRLDSGVPGARDALRTAVANGTFDRDFVPAGSGAENRLLGNLVARFWERLSLSALASVASGAQRDAISAKDAIRTDPRFPIVPPKPDVQDLTPTEVVAAAKGISTLLPPEGGQAGAPRLEIGRPAFDEEIQRLFGRGVVGEADRIWFSQVRAVLRGLPENESEVLKCSIRVLTAKEKKAGDVLAREDIYPYVGLAQGEARPTPQVYLRGADAPLGTVEFAGAPLRFGFFKTPDDPQPAAVVLIDGRWGPVRLLHANRAGVPLAEKITATQWVVELLVEDAAVPGRMLSVWLQLDFPKEFPAVKDWPR